MLVLLPQHIRALGAMTYPSYSFGANGVPHHYNKHPQLTPHSQLTLTYLFADHHLQLYFYSNLQIN
jgi:hypothetical protein